MFFDTELDIEYSLNYDFIICIVTLGWFLFENSDDLKWSEVSWWITETNMSTFYQQAALYL